MVLWPTLHNVLSLYGPVWNRDLNLHPTRISKLFDAYRKVNRAFARKIVTLMSSPSDVLWLHDYHLMLLPQLTRLEIQKRWPTSTLPPAIIFFFHCAFPTSEIFRVLGQRRELIRGILGADLIGFHSYNHARHFLNTCRRLLGLKYQSRRGGMLSVNYMDRSVGAIIMHVGIDRDYIAHRQATEESRRNEAMLRQRHSGKTLIVGLDQCQRLQGIVLKLLAFERLLAESDALRDKVVFVQRCRLPMQRSKDTEMTRQEVRTLIERIRRRFGAAVIDYEERSIFSLNERLGYFSAADVMISTPVGSEHLNMNPLEYVFCHRKQENKDDQRPPGVVVLSEFSMASDVMNGALCVNPFNLESVTRALDTAIRMSPENRALRISRDVHHVTLASHTWSRRMLECLDEMWNPAAGSSAIAGLDDIVDMEAVVAEPATTPVATDEIHANATGKQNEAMIASHALGAKTEFSPLNMTHLKSAYGRSRRRLLIFNYNGTLATGVHQSKHDRAWRSSTDRDLAFRAGGAAASSDVLTNLRRISDDPLNAVFVVSGLSASALGKLLGSLKNLSLVARNGLCISYGENFATGANRKSGTGESICGRVWHRLYPDKKVDNGDWKTRAGETMRKFCSRVNGSTVREEEWQVRWDYRGCDPEWAAMQVPHLLQRLESELSDIFTKAGQLQILRLTGQVSVLPKWICKGAAVTEIVHLLDDQPDFVLCIGDDATDDEMFSALYRQIEEQADSKSNSYLFTCMVGVKATNARLCISDTDEVASVLRELSGGEKR